MARPVLTLRDGGRRISHLLGVDVRRGVALVVVEEWCDPDWPSRPHAMTEVMIGEIRAEGVPPEELPGVLADWAVVAIDDAGELSRQRELV